MRDLRHRIAVKGYQAEIHDSEQIVSFDRLEDRARLRGHPNTTNSIHIAVPTPVIIDDERMRVHEVWYRYKAQGDVNIDFTDTIAYDGERPIRLQFSEAERIPSDSWTLITIPTVPSGNFVGVNARLAIFWGIGLTINVEFGPRGGEIELESAGCEFARANPICDQRLPIRTDRHKIMEFPYCSNLPIDLANPDITRIIVAVHGTGGEADAELEYFLDEAPAHVRDSTLFIAPQFVQTDECYLFRVNSHFGRVLFWDGGRAYGAQSVEIDLSGDGIRDSGTISSFTVMDTLLRHINRESLFPNLNSIVLAGHSNGGQFVNRYAAAGLYESELMNDRPISLRYVVMNPGGYLYFDETRQSDGHGSSFEEPDRTECPFYNRYPAGLEFDAHTLDNYPYVFHIGTDKILEQYPLRHVVYMVGENDVLGSWTRCEDLLQGEHRYERALIYWDHLRNRFPDIVRTQDLVTIPGVDHDGRRMIHSAVGQRVIFGTIP